MIRVIRFMNFIQAGRHVGVRSLLICTTISSYVKCATGLVCLDGSFRFRNLTTNKSVNLINNTDILYNCEIQRGMNTTAKMADLPNLKSANLLKLSDYDCIGFDLDYTLCEYNIATVVQMEFEVLAKFMVEEKGYDPEFLLKPVTDKDIDFFHKGLLIDKNKGNIIHIDKNGTIYRASHGTTILNDDEIIKYYGKDKKWEVANGFVNNILNAWEGPISEQIRALLDYFDMPASLIFARIVDSLDAKLGKPADIYKVWPDVLEGLINMYKREHFSLNKGGFFPRLKANPAKFLNKCHPLLIDWLKDIKKNKKSIFNHRFTCGFCIIYSRILFRR
uniref:5'-nucleotidase domain-containing protein 1 n=1 Tax=Clastoptera arizonana TaxID=38151 RepID=A0A1B6E8H6_9HEMI